MKTNWRLPRGVDELLPPAAWELEQLRRAVLDLFVSWGYEYVEPPIIEYLDALLVGSGEDLDLQTLKVVDQVTGRQLGVRADLTSQAVRIDAHSLQREGIQRLCYAGPVVFANPQATEPSRVPIKAGVEIFGERSIAADAEVVNLMIAAVRQARVQNPVLLLGHMGIYLGIREQLQLDEQQASSLFACVQRKSQADIAELLGDGPAAQMMTSLPMLMGGVDIIDQARDQLADAGPAVVTALDELAELVGCIQQYNADLDICIDVAELSGYGYHNGPVFAVYHPEHGSALAQGGRYDGIGAEFGRGRPATGFDMKLKALLNTTGAGSNKAFAPYLAGGDGQHRDTLIAQIAQLRAAGWAVVQALSAAEEPGPDTTHRLVQVDGQWQIASLGEGSIDV